MTFYVQRDAPMAVRRVLRDAPFLKDIRVVAKTTNQSVEDGPYVMVTGDGTPSGSIATASENVRINVFAEYEPDARDLARVIDGWLQDPSGGSDFEFCLGQILSLPRMKTPGDTLPQSP